MKTEHRQGPWSANSDGTNWKIQTEDNWPVALVFGTKRQEAINVANARLIAAAPELLDALVACSDYLSRFAPPGSTTETDSALCFASIAIEKATGIR